MTQPQNSDQHMQSVGQEVAGQMQPESDKPAALNQNAMPNFQNMQASVAPQAQ